MRVLIAGETSGKSRDAFRKLGHDAISCDLLPSDVPGPHIQGNYFDVIYDEWDLAILHPTCTWMCNSGGRWLYEEEGRWDKMVQSAEEFRVLLELPYPFCIENPIMHGHAKAIIGRDQDQIVQPWMFGHRETKATCFWLNRLPLLRPTLDLGPPPSEEKTEWAKVHRMAVTEDRWKKRSETYQGIADAMARQWGGLAPGLEGQVRRLDYQLELLGSTFHGAHA